MQKHFTAILVSLFILGCTDKKQTGPTQGLVRYSIDYPDEIKSKPIFGLLPVEMDLLFDTTAVKLAVKGDLNLFSLEFLSRAKGDSCFTIFRMPTKRMVYQLGKDEKWFLFEEGTLPEPKLHPDSLKNIAGFDCRLVEFRYKSDSRLAATAFFTDQLSVDPSLFRMPFRKIPGVPMEFEVDFNGLIFKFKAQKFLPFPSDEKMILPAEYEITSRKEIRSIIDYFLD
ncbi:MAG: hypothetical protein QM786_11050 [Breznakibacter sp.]